MELFVFPLNVRFEVAVQSVSVSAVNSFSPSVAFVTEVASEAVIIGYLA
jgi:hypothetical protein